MKNKKIITRRSTLKGIGAVGAASILPHNTLNATTKEMSSNLAEISTQVNETYFVDTHEHLIEEKGRFTGTRHPRVRADDWTMVFSHYIDDDLRVAGMSREEYDRFFSPEINPVDKWKIIEPYWPFVKHTGYGMASHLAVQQLYGVPELSGQTIRTVQQGYEALRKPGFYKKILQDMARIESCQVNSLEGTPFMKSSMPEYLMQDISLVGMYAWVDIPGLSQPAGIDVTSLEDWYRVIDWWFQTYGPYAVAVKSQHAYSRNIDYDPVPEERAAPIFQKLLNQQELTSQELKSIQDHLFWYSVHRAVDYDLPVKLHTGYYAGHDNMPLNRLLFNAGAATDLCSRSPDTRFVFMHICYPYYEELMAAAKNFSNCYIDMCWSWLINPIAAKDFLKKYLLTAPANKILTFGGDYIPVEPVLGHAMIARRGISLALTELVQEGWINIKEALTFIDPIMRGNAKRIFALESKQKKLKNTPW